MVIGPRGVQLILQSYEQLIKSNQIKLSITSMITDRIERHEVTLPITFAEIV